MYYLEVHEATNKLLIKKSVKRLFDILLSITLLSILFIPILFLVIFSSIVNNTFGFFTQERVGENGHIFTIFKIRTINTSGQILKFGRFMRKSKLDELPQLFNILIGDMSFVGPRPDIIGFADKLNKEDKVILSFKPGLTGPATLKYINEEIELNNSSNPNELLKEYWEEKVRINKEYVLNYYLYKDICYLFKTLFYVIKNMAFTSSSYK